MTTDEHLEKLAHIAAEYLSFEDANKIFDAVRQFPELAAVFVELAEKKVRAVQDSDKALYDDVLKREREILTQAMQGKL